MSSMGSFETLEDAASRVAFDCNTNGAACAACGGPLRGKGVPLGCAHSAS